MPTLYLHIGTPKTGSTAIQEFCKGNAGALARRGYCYPLAIPFEGAFTRHNAGFMLYSRQDGEKLPNGQELNRKWEQCFEKVADYLREYPNLILSEEMIWLNSKMDAIERIKKTADENGFAIKLIVYLRRQDMFLSSRWAQDVKGNYNERAAWKWEELLARADETLILDYYARLEEFAAVVGRENIVVRVYERERFPEGNIVLDFLDVLGLKMEQDYVLPEGERNLSIGGNTLEIKRIINGLPAQSYELKQKAWDIAVDCFKSEKKEMVYSAFSAEEQRAILEKYEESNCRVARDYLGDESGSLFASPGPLPPKWEADNPFMYESIVRFFWLTIMRQQEEIEELKSKFYLRRKLRTLWRKLRSRLHGRSSA